MAEISRIDEAYCWNLTRLADAFGMHRDTIRKKINAAGVQPAGTKSGAKVYAIKDVAPALFSVPASEGGYGGYESPDDMPPGDRKDWYDSELKRLKVGQEEKRLVPDDEVAREMSFLIKAVVNPLDGLTDTLERKADLSPKQAGVVQVEIDGIREQMYLAALQHGEECEED